MRLCGLLGSAIHLEKLLARAELLRTLRADLFRSPEVPACSLSPRFHALDEEWLPNSLRNLTRGRRNSSWALTLEPRPVSPFRGELEAPSLILSSASISVAHLAPGSIPVVRTVTSWPSSKNESKLSSLLYFDAAGHAVAWGAECLAPEMRARALKEGLQLAKWWKLHLHPNSMQFETTATLASTLLDRLSLGSTTPKQIVPDFEVPPLPPNVKIDLVYSSFFKYLFENTRK